MLIFGANIKTVTKLIQVSNIIYTISEHKIEAFYTDIYLAYKISAQFNPLQTKRRLFYLKTQFVPRSKHFSSRL